MTDQFVQLAADGVGKKVDTSELTVNSQTVERQRINITDPTLAAGMAAVGNTAPVGTEYGLLVRPLMSDVTATGTITTTDAVVAAPAGAGVFVSGASTAGSLVAVATNGGDSAWNVQITGLTSGTLYFEGSLDSTNGTDGNWINVNGRQTGVVNTVLAGNATTNGMYRGNTSGLKWWRVRAVGALSGTPAIVVRVSDGTGAVFLNASIPSGTNTIGNIGTLTNGLPTGANTIGAVSSIVAGLPSGSNNIGNIGSIVTSLPTGTNNIGSVTVAGLPVGANTIGAVTINSIATGANTIGVVNQGTPAVTSASWPHKITDGTNIAAVKASSTAAATTDPSLVVAIHPSSPLPGGLNTIGNIGTLATLTNGLPTGANTIGSIAAITTGLPTGANNIGSVTVAGLPTGANNIGGVTINSISAGANTIGAISQGPANTASGAWTVKVTDGTNVGAVKAASTAAVAADPALVVAFSPNSLTIKGTQPISAVPTQDIKDSGRVNIAWTLDNFTITSVAETMLTVTESKDGATISTFSSKVITSGKRFRITSCVCYAEAAGSTPVVSRVTFRIRVNTFGAVSATSNIQNIIKMPLLAATAKTVVSGFQDFPDGFELLGNGNLQIGISVICPEWASGTNTPIVSLSLFGFEY